MPSSDQAKINNSLMLTAKGCFQMLATVHEKPMAGLAKVVCSCIVAPLTHQHLTRIVYTVYK